MQTYVVVNDSQKHSKRAQLFYSSKVIHINSNKFKVILTFFKYYFVGAFIVGITPTFGWANLTCSNNSGQRLVFFPFSSYNVTTTEEVWLIELAIAI